MTGFQKTVNTQPAPAVAGDFASANPRYSVDAGPGGLVAGPAGLFVGRAAWWSGLQLDANDTPAQVNNHGSGPITGIVPREQQGMIQVYLEEFSMRIAAGFEITLMSNADMWVMNEGTTPALVGQFAYAAYANGAFSFAAANAPGTASGSASSIAAATSSFTGSIADEEMAVTAVASGTLYPGTSITGTGVASGSKIVGQLLPLEAGEAVGGIGRYNVNVPNQTVASTTISGTYGVLTVGGTVAGAFGVGDTLSGTNVVAGTTITQQLTGPAGGAGTYVVDNNTVVASTAITAGTSVQTKWIAMSAGQVGDLIKISAQPLG